jgi:hypothetical protein
MQPAERFRFLATVSMTIVCTGTEERCLAEYEKREKMKKKKQRMKERHKDGKKQRNELNKRKGIWKEKMRTRRRMEEE